MLARVVLAVACSIAAIKYARLKTKPEPLGRGAGGSHDEKEIHTCANKHASLEEKEDAVKCESLVSPSLSGRSFRGNDRLLLPEFDDLCQEVIDISLDSDNSASGVNSCENGQRLKHNSASSGESKYDSNSDDDDGLHAFEALTTFTDQGSLRSNSSEEIAELKTIIEDLREREMKLETELLHYYGLKEQENNYLELERQLLRKNAELKSTIENFKEREMKHEAELLQYYGLKDQKINCIELERQLLKKNGEIEKLRAFLKSLQEEKDEIEKEVQGKECMKEELDLAEGKIKDLQISQKCLKGELSLARDTIKELQITLQNDANQSMEQHLFLKQQISELQKREQEASKKCLEMERKLQKLNEFESEARRLGKECNDLKHQEHELKVKLDKAEAKIVELSSGTETDIMENVEMQTSTLTQENEDLRKQVEGLQMSRLGEVEELVDLRWVNVCLRNEVQHYKLIIQKATDLALVKNLSPKSKQKAIRLMLEHGELERVSSKPMDQTEQDFESISSLPSTPSEHDPDDSFMDSISERNTRSKKSSFIKRLKKWGRGKRDSQSSTSTSSEVKSSDSGMSSPIHGSSKLKDSFQSLLMRNASDYTSVAIGTSNFQSSRNSTSDSNKPLGESAPLRRRSKVSSAEHLDVVLPSFGMISMSMVDTEIEKRLLLKQRHNPALTRVRSLKENVDQDRIVKLTEMLQPVTVLSKNMEKNNSKVTDLQKRDCRIPIPVPKPSLKRYSDNVEKSVAIPVGPDLPSTLIPSQMPGPPPTASRQLQGLVEGKTVQKAPELPASYPSHMRLKEQKYSVGEPLAATIHDIENSSVALPIKTNVDTQGDFIRNLAREVQTAAYDEIEDMIAFVSWLDEELSFLVDDQAILKHFDWPETKSNSLREAAYEYRRLRKLEAEISSFKDDSNLTCDASLNKMLLMLEKVEQYMYPLLRIRDTTISQYKDLSIPTQWMLDSGLVGKIKVAAVQLARKFMKRVISELDSAADAYTLKVPQREILLLQGVRFALRVHEFAGGFDPESMHVFEDLRRRVSISCPNQPQ